MTSPSRRKRPTTARGRSRPITTTCSLAALTLSALLGAGGTAGAQQLARPVDPSYPARTVRPARPAPTGPAPHHLPASPAFRYAPPVRATPVGGNPADSVLQPVAYQPPGLLNDNETAPEVQLEPPGLHALAATMLTETAWKEREVQREKDRDPTARLTFPQVPILSREPYRGRGNRWPEQNLLIAPNYVCYGRLLFEQRNAERYGWDLGVLQPVLSGATFFGDFATLPYHLATNPLRCRECSAGYCLPGDPVPLRLYPPGLSLTGTTAEVATILGLVAIFP